MSEVNRMDNIYKSLLCKEIGEYVLRAIGETCFEKEVESSAVSALRKIQKIILNDEIGAEHKILKIEDIFIDYNLQISPIND